MKVDTNRALEDQSGTSVQSWDAGTHWKGDSRVMYAEPLKDGRSRRDDGHSWNAAVS
jgi:hypothetical protein